MTISGNVGQGLLRPMARKVLLASALIAGGSAVAHAAPKAPQKEDVTKPAPGRLILQSELPIGIAPEATEQFIGTMMDICENQADGKLSGPQVLSVGEGKVDSYKCAGEKGKPLNAEKLIPDPDQRKELLDKNKGILDRILFLFPHDKKFPAPKVGK